MFLRTSKLPFLIALLLTLVCGAMATGGAKAQDADGKPVEQVLQDVDAAYQPAPERKLFSPGVKKKITVSPGKAASSPKSSGSHSKDFYEAHHSAPRKTVRRAVPKQAEPAVQASDLMNAMKEGMNPTPPQQVLVPTQEDAPAATGAAKKEVAKAATPGQQIIKPIPSSKLFQPGKPTNEVNDVLTDALPDVAPKATPAPVASAPTPTPTIDAPTKDVKADTPKKDDKGVPLLTELDSAPSGAEDVKGVAVKAAEPPPPASAPKEAPPTESMFAKPRPLFSAMGDTRKRAGIRRVMTAEAMPDLPPLPSSVTPGGNAQMIKPLPADNAPVVESKAPASADIGKKSIWGPANPEMTKGKVLYSQAADGTSATAAPTSLMAENAANDNDVTTPIPVTSSHAGNRVNASCGAMSGQGLSSKPVTELCTKGSPSEVTGNGPWNWTCYGMGGGINAECSASLQVVGQCGSANQVAVISPPTSDLCASGVPSEVSGYGPWYWTCASQSGGSSTCSAPVFNNATCGSAHGVGTASPPTANLCAQGKPTSVIGSGPFMWSCQAPNSDSVVNCMAPLVLNGICGPANGVPTKAAPIDGLCNAGKPTPVNGSGPYIWSCAGAGKGITVSCAAPLKDGQTPIATPSMVSTTDASATPMVGSECTPSVKRWTITCQQGGYPSNYGGMIVGETERLCPGNVERGVWVSNTCVASDESAPVSPKPGVLTSLKKAKAAANKKKPANDMNLQPLPVETLSPPGRLFTPHYKRGSSSNPEEDADVISVPFAPNVEGLSVGASATLENMMGIFRADEKSIITLNGHAADKGDGDPQESRRLALARALAVRSFLVRKGISATRIDIRAVGPANDTHGDDRVDIKIK